MKKAAIYGRVSTSEQKEQGTSLETQVDAIVAYCEREGYEPIHIFKEDFSGEHLERPLLDRAKELAKEGQIEALLVYDWDRLSRDSDHQIVLRWMFDHWGVEVICITEPRLDGIRLKMQRGMDAIFAEWEKEKITERTMRGKRERARRGKLLGGYFLYGTSYDPDTGTRKKDVKAWPILNLIFERIASGYSLIGVASYLNSQGIPAPAGARWYISTISRIIRNRAYLGETYAFVERREETPTHKKPLSELRYRKNRRIPRPKDEWVPLPQATPVLIPEALFDAANERVRTRAVIYGKSLHQYLLKGRVRCSCGAKMHGTACTGYRYYRCSGRKQGFCDAPLVRADKLESIVWEEVKKVLLSPELILAYLETGQKTKSSGLLESGLKQRLAGLDVEERRLYRLYAQGKYDQVKLDDELDRIRTERSTLQEQLEEVKRQAEAQKELVDRKRSIEQYCQRARENIEGFGVEQKRLAISALGIKVLIDGKTVVLSGFLPAEFGLVSTNRGWR